MAFNEAEMPALALPFAAERRGAPAAHAEIHREVEKKGSKPIGI